MHCTFTIRGVFMKGVIKKAALFLGSGAAIMLILVGAYFVFSPNEDFPPESPEKIGYTLTQTKEEEVRPMENMLEETLKCVVGISSADKTNGITGKTEWYMGSGILASGDGYIITNHHVIGARPERIEVTLHNGETLEGKTVWSEKSLDLAIVKIGGGNYPHCKLGNAHNLNVGENVFAIGNPLSMRFQRTVTAGIVSALGRSISVENSDGEQSYMEDLIQTDASINPGNSGGPLVNAQGEVVGINTVKVTSAEGMGFAVPINLCIPVIERLKFTGDFKTPYLGLYAYTPEAARYLEIKDNMRGGLFVAKLDTDGPAFRSGIRYGDIITAINGQEITTMLSLREELYRCQSGDRIELTVVRGGAVKNVLVKLSATNQ